MYGVLLLPLLPTVLAASPPAWPDLSAPPAGGGDGRNDAAVLIGIEDYAFLDDIPGAGKNIDDWEGWLLRTRGVPASAVVTLRDRDAQSFQIRKAIETARSTVRSGGTLWVVWVGHGAPGTAARGGAPEALLLGVDANGTGEGVETRSVSRTEVEALLGGGKQANTVLVLDTCFSGKGARGSWVDGGKKLAVRAPAAWGGTADLTVLAAAEEDQYAGLLPGQERPAFSYLVLGAMRGWGDVDRNGVVTASEAKDYATGVLNVIGRRQSPQLSGPDTSLARGREAGPDLLALRAWKGWEAASTAAGSDRWAAVPELDLERELAEQGCAAEAERNVPAIRDAALAAQVGALADEASDKWSELAPKAISCLELSEAAARARCADVVDAWIKTASTLEAELPAGSVAVETTCGERSRVVPAAARAVPVPELTEARSVSAKLRKSGGTRATTQTTSRSTPRTKVSEPVARAEPARVDRAPADTGLGFGFDVGTVTGVRGEWRFDGAAVDAVGLRLAARTTDFCRGNSPTCFDDWVPMPTLGATVDFPMGGRWELEAFGGATMWEQVMPWFGLDVQYEAPTGFFTQFGWAYPNFVFVDLSAGWMFR